MVQPFLPNEADAFADRQASPESVDFDILLLGYQRTGVLSGCAVTESGTPAQTIDVAAGEVLETGEQISVSAQAGEAVTAAHATLDRIDLISINSSGSVVVTPGTAAAVPAAPAVPASSVPLAFLLVPATDDVHHNAQIVDKRVFIADRYVFNVKNFGAVGDGATDDTTEIQAAVDAMSSGDHLFFPVGVYRITSAIDFTTPVLLGIRISGSAGVSHTEGSYVGSSIRCDTDAQVGFDFDQAALEHEGPTIEHLNFIDNTTAENAVLVSITDMDHFAIENCSFRAKDPVASNDGGIGIRLSLSEDNAWGMIKHCRFIGLDRGISSVSSVGHTVIGGMFDMHAGQVGIFCDDFTQHWRIIGTKFDGVKSTDIGIHFDGAGFNSVSACHFESLANGVLIDNNATGLNGDQNNVVNCVFADITTGITVGSGILATHIVANRYITIGTALVDNGDDTIFMEYWNGAQIKQNAPYSWTIDGTKVGQASGSPEGAITAPVGSIQLRNDGALGTSLYYKASGAGNTGWRPVDTGATEEAGAFTLGWEDSIVNVNSAAATRAGIVPDNANFAGKGWLVRRDGANQVTLTRSGSDTFSDGDTVKTLDSDGAAIGFFSIGDGEYKIVGTEGTVGGS